MRLYFFLLLAFLALIFVACSNDSDNGNNQKDQPVRIGIAWRADVSSEFYTNVVRALKEAGAITSSRIQAVTLLCMRCLKAELKVL